MHHAILRKYIEKVSARKSENINCLYIMNKTLDVINLITRQTFDISQNNCQLQYFLGSSF